MNPSADEKIARDGHLAGPARRHEIVQYLVGHRLVEGPLVPIRPKVKLQGLEFKTEDIRDVGDFMVAKSGWPVLGHRQVNSGH